MGFRLRGPRRRTSKAKRGTRARRLWFPGMPAIEALESRRLLSQVFTVTNTLDNPTTGSLRWAIGQVDNDPADSSSDPDRIDFAIPATDAGFAAGVWTIAPTSALPALSRPAVLDGYTQPGASPNTNGPGQPDDAVLKVVLTGSKAPAGIAGLELSSTGITVEGLVVNDFALLFPPGQPSVGGDGIMIDGVGGDVIVGDFLGTNAAGTAAAANGGGGIFLSNAGNNTIGGNSPAAVNLISGNAIEGILAIGNSVTGNVIEGNLIGLDSTGTKAVPNGNGVSLTSGSNNTIGGTTAGAENVIAGNGGRGILISGPGASGNLIAGNLIGITANGGLNLGNRDDGVALESGAFQTTIGGTTAAARNVITNSGSEGNISIFAQSPGNVVEGNFIGTNLTGTMATPGTDEAPGILLAYDSKFNTIGGTSAGARNVIAASPNDSVGILIQFAGTSENRVEGNFIGVDVTGTSRLGDGLAVEIVDGASGNIIGGTSPGTRNVMTGLEILGLEGTTSGNLVEGNFIGTDATGTHATPGAVEIADLDGSDNTIGGTVAGAGNVIAGTVGLGDVTNDLVQGNFIGVDPSGTISLGNSEAGVDLGSGSTGNTIGGIAAGAGNVIADNALQGVEVVGTNSSGNAILGNSIYGNGKLGIDLVGGTEDSFGVTTNTPGGSQSGPNDLQNYPVITSAIDSVISGTLNAAPNTAFTIEFFANPAIDPSGHGQGKIFLGRLTNVGTDPSGKASFSFNAPSDITGQFVSATATDPLGNTSEFAQDVEATGNTPPADVSVDVSPSSPTVGTAGQSGTFTFTVTNNGPNVATNLVLTNVLPPSLTNPSVESSNPALTTITNAGNTFTTTVASLPVGASFTETFTAGLTSVGTISDTLQVTGVDTVDPNWGNNQATASLNVAAPAQTPTKTTITTPSSPFPYGSQPLFFTVTVTPQLNVGVVPTGMVEVSLDNGPAFAAPLGDQNGVASNSILVSQSPLSVGSHTVTITYEGDAHFAGSTATITQVIERDTVVPALTAAPNPSEAGQPVTFTMAVGVPGLTEPTGVVTFYDGSTALGTVSLSGPTPVTATLGVVETFSAQFTTRGLLPGTHQITAVYQGDANFQPVTSNLVSQVVQPLPGGPSLITVQRFGEHLQPTTLVLTFNEPLAAIPAQNVNNYLILPEGPRGRVGRPIPVRSAAYVPDAFEVILTSGSRLNLHRAYKLVLNSNATTGLTDGSGTPFGHNVTIVINRSTFAGPASAGPPASGKSDRTKARPHGHVARQ